MDSTVPTDLLKLKARLEDWRSTCRYVRQPIPDEFRQAAAEMARRFSPSLVRCILKLNPGRLKKPETKRSAPVHHKPQTAFFTLPPDAAFPEPRPLATSLTTGCRLLVERPDGACLAVTLPSLDLAFMVLVQT